MQYLLLQLRDDDDPMRAQEVACFARALECRQDEVIPFDLLAAAPTPDEIAQADALLVGGSGNYSAAGTGAWLQRAMGALRQIVEMRAPLFASCWGFQALARALGGRCIHDPQRAELGTIALNLDPAADDDPVFGTLPKTFLGQAGHEDCVVELPPGAVRLASSDRVENQAFRLLDAPVYCTQFHPELDRTSLLERVEAYPQYVERIAGTTFEQFQRECQETPAANALLRRFKEQIQG